MTATLLMSLGVCGSLLLACCTVNRKVKWVQFLLLLALVIVGHVAGAYCFNKGDASATVEELNKVRQQLKQEEQKKAKELKSPLPPAVHP